LLTRPTIGWLSTNRLLSLRFLKEANTPHSRSKNGQKNQWPDSILCHRIDRETSGLLLIAKNPEAYRHFSMQFEHRKVHKIYHAIVNGQLHFNDLWIDLPIIAEQLGKIRIDRKNGKPAQTRFKSLQVFKHFTLMECEPKTGRLHQIRVHLQSQNACIAGDTLYGSDIPMLSWVKRKLHGTDTPLIQRFALHAKQMRIQAPDGTDLVLEAPYSKDIEVMLKHLNKYNQ